MVISRQGEVYKLSLPSILVSYSDLISILKELLQDEEKDNKRNAAFRETVILSRSLLVEHMTAKISSAYCISYKLG